MTLFLALLLLFPASSFGCSCAGLPPSEDVIDGIVDESDVVITGRVVEFLYAEPVTHENLIRHVGMRVAVIESFKGADGMAEIVLATDDTMCGYGLTLGDTYLFFVPSSTSGQLRIHGCSTFLYTTTQKPRPDYMDTITDKVDQVLSILRRPR